MNLLGETDPLFPIKSPPEDEEYDDELEPDYEEDEDSALAYNICVP